MAIAEKLQNIINEKSKQKDVTNYGLPSASQIDNNTKFIEYPDYIYDAFLETLKSPETLWGNLPKVTGSGTSITLNDTTNTKMRMTLSASEIMQASTPTPESPQAVHVISGDNTITISNSDNTLSQQVTLNLGDIEYCKSGSYEDRIFKNVVGDTDYSSDRDLGAWYIKKNVGKVVFNGSENWSASSLSVTGYKSFYTSSAFDENESGFCNRFRLGTYRNWIDLLADNFFEFANNSLGIRIQESLASDLQSFKSWLSNNNVIIYGVEKIPTYTKITGTLAYQLEDVYNNSLAYDGQTNITQANNDLPFIINAEIPSGFIKNFTRLNYIQSSATQYLSISDFYPTNNTRIKTSFEGLANTNTTWVFGARQGYQNKEFGFHATNGYTDCYGNDRRVLSGYNLVNGLELDKNKATTNINNTHTLTHTANTFTAPCPLNIFALNNNGTQGVAPSALKMYYFEIYENDVLIHNLIPAKRKSDNEIGMYDLVSGTFYTNQGTGSFSGE